jgi:hypothetical protein
VPKPESSKSAQFAAVSAVAVAWYGYDNKLINNKAGRQRCLCFIIYRNKGFISINWFKIPLADINLQYIGIMLLLY